VGFLHGQRPGDETDPFRELGLTYELLEKVGGVRVRQHVNPLKRELQIVPEAPAWGELFEDAGRPLVVDIGFGSGRFLLLYAKRSLAARRARGTAALWETEKGCNFLGMDIRAPLVERANGWTQTLAMQDNVHFMTANASISIGALLRSYPGPVLLANVQFPDPHFKKKHHKRRIVQEELVKELVDLLPVGGRVWLQSDVEEVGVDMRRQFYRHHGGHLAPVGGLTLRQAMGEDSPGGIQLDEAEREEETAISQEWPWLAENELGVPTERETACVKAGYPIFRILLEKVA